MRAVVVILVAAAVLGARLWRRRRPPRSAPGAEAGRHRSPWARPGRSVLPGLFGTLGVVAGREIRERVRGRMFRFGTLAILLAVGAAIVIPTLHRGVSGPTLQRVGVVGGLSAAAGQALQTAAARNGDTVSLQPEASPASAGADLQAGRIDLAIVDGERVVLDRPAGSSGSGADPALVDAVARDLGALRAFRAAGLTPAQAAQVSEAGPVPVQTLRAGTSSTTRTSSVIGIVLLFLMLTQYDTWILIGVMQEKSSRVVEVLLATLRPIQLLGGKVLGIGVVALSQAALIVGFALALAEAVGSNLLQGAAPLALAAELLWLVLGYAFYCWVYAAAGSTAERQDQVQTLALPLSIPIIIAYVFSIATVSSGHASLFFEVLAYLPPTAPFCMSALVALHQVTWWGFTVSALLTVAATGGTAVFAAGIYRRAVLRTGGRVHLRELMSRPAR